MGTIKVPIPSIFYDLKNIWKLSCSVSSFNKGIKQPCPFSPQRALPVEILLSRTPKISGKSEVDLRRETPTESFNIYLMLHYIVLQLMDAFPTRIESLFGVRIAARF
jgi:hypothetical protein